MSTDAQPQRRPDPSNPQGVSQGSRWKRGGIAVAVVAVMASAGALILDTVTSGEPAALQTRRISRGDLDVTIIEEGTLESYKNTEILCEIRGGYGGKGGSSGEGWGRITVNWVVPSGTMVKAGDELVRLDTKEVDETVSLGKTDTNLAKAELSEANVSLEKAEIGVEAYLEGQHRSQLKGMQSAVTIAESNLAAAKKTLGHSELLFNRGYVTELELKGNALTVTQAELDLKVAQTNIDVFERLTKEIELERRRGQLIATTARVKGRKAGLVLEQGRLDLALQEQQNCLIKAKRDGLVIYPSAAGWKHAPDIQEGATVRQDQVLLLMPDLSRMQVTIGIHESIIERVYEGLSVRVTLPDQTVDTVITSVAVVTRPAGWWTGNVVEYDAVIELPEMAGLKPGMSAEVEVVVARHENVLMVPGQAVIDTGEGYCCWVDTADGPQRRPLKLGDSNLRDSEEEFIVVHSGVEEGEQVVLDPASSIEEAQAIITPAQTHKITRSDLSISVTEQGTLESSNNIEIKNKVRGMSTITWVIESGTEVKPGDELVRLDNKAIEEQVAERTKYAFLSKDASVGSAVRARVAEIAIPEYLEGRYIAELSMLEKDLALAASDLSTAQNMRDHAVRMEKRGYESALEVEQREFRVTQAQLNVQVKRTDIDVLKRFSKQEELERLQGELNVATAMMEKDKEVLFLDDLWLKRIREELTHCVVKADRSGLVIHPTTEEWKDSPDVTEGAVIHQTQVLLLMPDLSKMQAKVGIHESIVDRVKPGMAARVTLPDRTVAGKVSSVASVTSPAGWWTGNVVKYDTLIELPAVEGLKPGMSAEVEVILDRYQDVLTIPVSAVVETAQGYCCWVETSRGPQRRVLQLGDSNNVSIVVESGLVEGDEVVINPTGSIEEAQTAELRQRDDLQPVQHPSGSAAEPAEASSETGQSGQ
ncbi:MAG: hypothetical protein CMJ59_10605 [Planctomycetaceae bacterium]|nr:hypothetical protein [Planctomycetaceae bacterium]